MAKDDRIRHRHSGFLGGALGVFWGISAACMLCDVCFGQTTTVAGPEATPSQPLSPAYARARRVPEELLGEPRGAMLILPSEPGQIGQDPEQLSGGTRKTLLPELRLLPEGSMIAGREGRIRKGDQWYEVDLLPSPGFPDAPPLRILPNQRLSMLELVVAEAETPPVFMITGRVMAFLDANYLLIDDIEEVSRRSLKPSEWVETNEAGEQASRPAEVGEPTAEDIMQRLLQLRPPKPVPTTHEAAPAPAEGPASEGMATGTSTLPDGTLLHDRVGRLLRGDPYWMLVFENQGQRPTDKPIRVLPNRLLETAISLSRGGTGDAIFITSGEVTAHKGTNYLLLRKVLLRRDLGNLR